jgi:phage repressor protein C with HTH and peptisase S24 domain
MAKSDLSIKIGTAISTARKRRGFVQRHIAEALGVQVAAVGQWEIGKNTPSMDNLLKVAEFLRIDAIALSRGEILYEDDAALADVEIVGDPAPENLGALDVELLGVAYGGEDGDFTFNGQVNGYVRRPSGISRLRNVFATNVMSDSMSPRYEPGEIIYLGGREPTPGDYVVIEMHPDEEGQVGKAFIKKLKRRTASEIITEQFNPPKEVIFDRYRMKNLWRVIPWSELLGF